MSLYDFCIMNKNELNLCSISVYLLKLNWCTSKTLFVVRLSVLLLSFSFPSPFYSLVHKLFSFSFIPNSHVYKNISCSYLASYLCLFFFYKFLISLYIYILLMYILCRNSPNKSFFFNLDQLLIS